jgi:hypothetical protein
MELKMTLSLEAPRQDHVSCRILMQGGLERSHCALFPSIAVIHMVKEQSDFVFQSPI